MFKIITFTVLAVVLYRMIFPAPQINQAPPPQDQAEDEWVDYEEVD